MDSAPSDTLCGRTDRFFYCWLISYLHLSLWSYFYNQIIKGRVSSLRALSLCTYSAKIRLADARLGREQ